MSIFLRRLGLGMMVGGAAGIVGFFVTNRATPAMLAVLWLGGLWVGMTLAHLLERS